MPTRPRPIPAVIGAKAVHAAEPAKPVCEPTERRGCRTQRHIRSRMQRGQAAPQPADIHASRHKPQRDNRQNTTRLVCYLRNSKAQGFPAIDRGRRRGNPTARAHSARRDSSWRVIVVPRPRPPSPEESIPCAGHSGVIKKSETVGNRGVEDTLRPTSRTLVTRSPNTGGEQIESRCAHRTTRQDT
mgnify:CR=1 FL=1